MENRPLGSNSDRLGHDIIVIGGSSKSIHPEASGRESEGWSPKRALVVARNPVVSVAVPSPMARDPSLSTPWWWRTGRFGYEGWRGVWEHKSFLPISEESK